MRYCFSSSTRVTEGCIEADMRTVLLEVVNVHPSARQYARQYRKRSSERYRPKRTFPGNRLLGPGWDPRDGNAPALQMEIQPADRAFLQRIQYNAGSMKQALGH